MDQSALAERQAADLRIDLQLPERTRPPHAHTMLWLLLITIAGGVVRFLYLDRPPLLIDECFTFWRTCGTYEQLINTLRDDGFVPLHYELLWWIGRGMPIGNLHLLPHWIYLTPKVMRFVPAVCGTLMIPATYFVARQFGSKRASLIASILIAGSAYAQFFSRDAKMYAPAWLLSTTGIGCALWWLRSRKLTAWLCWIATAAAAGGVHIVTLLLLPLALVFLFSRPRLYWWQAVMMVVGLFIIVSGPLGYYGAFNRWTEKSGGIAPGVVGEPAPDANWQASGLAWIGNEPSASTEVFRSLSTYLTSFEWDGSLEERSWDDCPRWVRNIAIASITGMLGVFLLGALPWQAVIPSRTIGEPDDYHAWWRITLWLGLWMVIPAYGFFYCRSFDDPATPLQWLNVAASLWLPWPITTIIVSLTVSVCAIYFRGISLTLFWLAVATVALVTAGYASQHGDAIELFFARPGIHFVLMVIGPAMVVSHCGRTNFDRLKHIGQFVMITAAVLLICEVSWQIWDQVRIASHLGHPELHWQSIWHTRYLGIIFPAVWIAAAMLVSRLPTWPLRSLIILVIVAVNMANGLARPMLQTQVPYDRIMADVWQARPDTTTRTYFNLGPNGFPEGVYWRPMAAYNAAVAARMQTSPPDVRVGNAWPFVYGPIVDRFKSMVDFRPFTNVGRVMSDLEQSPAIDHVVIWNMADSSEEIDNLKERLGERWKLIHQDVHRRYWYWTWGGRESFSRREFVRTAIK